MYEIVNLKYRIINASVNDKAIMINWTRLFEIWLVVV